MNGYNEREAERSRNITVQRIDCSLSVNDLMAYYPSTLHVFNRFGVDTCCGGALSVEEAVRANDLDAAALCAALREATREAGVRRPAP